LNRSRKQNRKNRRTRIWKFFDKYTSQIIVCFSFALALVFVITVLIFSANSLVVPDTLIEWFFKFFGLELISLSGIKVSKHIGKAFGSTNTVEETVLPEAESEINGDPED